MLYFADGSRQGTQALVYADKTEDKDNLKTFAQNNRLKHGSKCFCFQDRTVVFMDSDGEWN